MKRLRLGSLLLALLLLAACAQRTGPDVSPSLSPSHHADAVAYDMVGSASLNLTSYANPFTGAFASPGDGFQIYNRNTSTSVPFAVLDDSLSIFPPDSLGIVKEGNTDSFFGVVDTENADNTGPVSATWVFDVSGASGPLELSIDMGAMGDFEASDVFTWSYSFDGGTSQTAFASSVDEAGSHTYTLEGGASFILDDPMLIDGTILDDDFATFTAPLVGSGSALTIVLTAQLDGGSEAVAFQNLIVAPSDGGAVAELVINEIDYDQPGFDTAEFVEIKNVGTGPADLSAYTLQFVNGSNDTVYATVALPAATLAAGDYFVVCANAATVANCDLDDSPDTNFLQNGAPDAVALLNGATVVDTVSYEGDTGAPYTEGSGAGLVDDPSVAFASISRFPDGVDTDQNNVDLSQRCISPGAANVAASSGCAPAATPYFIHEIQGSGAESPKIGEFVSIEGIVVGDFQDGAAGSDGDLNGFFVQEEDDDADADAATSEGIFVFDGSNPSVDVAVGDRVAVTGTVVENSTSGGASLETQIGNPTVTVLASAQPLPAVTDVILPVADVADLEAYEGMYIRLPQSLTIVEYFNYDRFGEMVLATERQFQPTAVFAPGSSEAVALSDLNARSRITLDDGNTAQNPQVTRHPNGDPFALDNRFRGGDLVQGAVGALGDAFGLYRLQPTHPANYFENNPRPTAPDPVGGDLTVASFNVLNYFLTLDDGVNDICGPDGLQECRGADNAEEFARQRAKILEALIGLDADIVGLIEMENTTGVSPLADIVSGLNDALGAGSYAYIDTGTIGTDAIKVGFIYSTDAVEPFGDYAILDGSVDPRFNDDKNRPVLAQSFLDRAGGGVVTVAVNHLKSKGSPCGDVGDPDVGDGQDSCNLTREAAAAALVDWLATDPTGSGQDDALIIGDLNSYDQEDPIAVLLAEDYTDLLAFYQGELAYTYVFSGQFGYLDYALSNESLTSQVTGATAWHINADEPDLLDYDTSFKSDGQDLIFDPTSPFRASDHDPVLVGLALAADVDAVIAALLDEVADLEADGALNSGQARALTRHLQQALRQYERGRIASARDLLTAFVDQVNEFVADGILDDAQGAALTGPAEALLSGL